MDGVLYLNVGSKHAEHLAVSLYSLLEHWEGEIAILVGDEKSAKLCNHFKPLGQVRLIPFDFEAMRVTKEHSGDIYLSKTAIRHLTPFDRTAFLDADTLVMGDISDVFPEDDEIRITRWMEWHSLGPMMSGRIRQWKDVAPEEVERQLSKSWPAINTGVIGFSEKCSQTMDAWAEMTARKVQFICDEIAMQLIFPDHKHMILDDRYNTSPCYEEVWKKGRLSDEWLDDLDHYYIQANGSRQRVVSDESIAQLRGFSEKLTDVRIWHGHGGKFVKKKYGRAVWWPMYRRAVAENFCGIADWTPWNRGTWDGQPLILYIDRHKKAETW